MKYIRNFFYYIVVLVVSSFSFFLSVCLSLSMLCGGAEDNNQQTLQLHPICMCIYTQQQQAFYKYTHIMLLIIYLFFLDIYF